MACSGAPKIWLSDWMTWTTWSHLRNHPANKWSMIEMTGLPCEPVPMRFCSPGGRVSILQIQGLMVDCKWRTAPCDTKAQEMAKHFLKNVFDWSKIRSWLNLVRLPAVENGWSMISHGTHYRHRISNDLCVATHFLGKLESGSKESCSIHLLYLFLASHWNCLCLSHERNQQLFLLVIRDW